MLKIALSRAGSLPPNIAAVGEMLAAQAVVLQQPKETAW
jgi:hypothetical protein